MATITVPGMFLTGTHAARPAANAVGIGTLYACSTHALVYQSDGSSWAQWFDGGAATLSAGSNSTHVREVSTAGASSTLWSPYDHAHAGVAQVTSSSSNTLQRGTVNFRAGANIGITATDTDGDGEFDTLTIHGAAAGAGGGSSLTVQDEGVSLSTAATTLNFVGSGVVASGTGATKTITIAGGGGGGFALDSYSIDATYGDDFAAGSLDGAWTRRNYAGGDETYQVGPDASAIRISKAGQSAGDGYFRTATSLPDGTYAMKFTPRFVAALTTFSWGIGVIDSSGSGIATCFYDTPRAPLLVQVTTYSTYGGAYVQCGAAGSSPNVSIWPTVPHAWAEHSVWVYIRKSSTNWYTAFSLDGNTWSPESSALAWSGTIDRIGMMDAPLGGITSGVGTGSFVDVDWFNRIA